ncbi:ABC transporter substrate-binding protein [Aeromonas salmonicida]
MPIIPAYEIWRNNPEKVFGVTRQWAERHPNTHIRFLPALLLPLIPLRRC